MFKDRDHRNRSENLPPLEQLSHREIYNLLSQKQHRNKYGEPGYQQLVDQTGHVQHFLFGGIQRYEHQHTFFQISRRVRSQNTYFIPSITAQFFLFEREELSNGKPIVYPSNKIRIYLGGITKSGFDYRERWYDGIPENNYWALETGIGKESDMKIDSFTEPTTIDVDILKTFGVPTEKYRPEAIQTKRTALNLVRNVLKGEFAFPEVETA